MTFSVHPKIVDLLPSICIAGMQGGMQESSEKALQALQVLLPDSIQPYLVEAILYVEQGKYDLASEILLAPSYAKYASDPKWQGLTTFVQFMLKDESWEEAAQAIEKRVDTDVESVTDAKVLVRTIRETVEKMNAQFALMRK